MATLLQIPPPNIPFLNPNGTVSDIWYQFLLAILTRAGGITGGLQPEDDTLFALAALSASAGIVVQTGADAFTKRSLAGVAGRTVVTNPAGTAGNPTVDLAAVAGVAGTYAPPASVSVDGYGRITAIS